MSDEGVWTLIESDPGVFTEMLRGFGVEGVQVEELHSLSEEETASYKYVWFFFLQAVLILRNFARNTS